MTQENKKNRIETKITFTVELYICRKKYSPNRLLPVFN